MTEGPRPRQRSRRGRRKPGKAVRENWDLVLGVFGLCGTTLTWLSPALGFPELQSTAAWVIFGGAAGILPVSAMAEWFTSRTR